MIFNSIPFLIFFAILLGLLFRVRGNTSRKLILLIASYIFYMWWNPAFILLIIASTVIDFFVGKRLALAESPTRRKLLLTTSMLANLGLLAWFKYATFMEANLCWFMRSFGYEPSWTMLNITLPVGISFYTFQTMSYTIDIYRRRLKPTGSPLDFALFVSFFPQLVAGPIVRAVDFIPQLSKPGKMRLDLSSFAIVLRGLIKKVIIADNIAVLVDGVFDNPVGLPSCLIWLATIGFGVQIYCDFSGYSEMAIGIARMLGYRLPVNFRRPYFATDPSDFWKRWHISLSSWLKDYLYIPLGGSRGGTLLTYRNLILTMLLGGLWHGASWNFVVWGAMHGVLLVGHRLYRNAIRGTGIEKASNALPYRIASIFLMQYSVLMTWIAFRVTDFSEMLYCMKKFVFFDGNFSIANLGVGTMAFFSSTILIMVFWILHIHSRIHGGIDERMPKWPMAMSIFVCIVAGVALFYLYPLLQAPFIYFQF